MAKGFMQLKFSEKSVSKLFADIGKLNVRFKTGGKKVLRETAKNIMAQSQSEVPRETGALASSAFIEQPKVTGNEVSIKLGYGGPNDKKNPYSGQMTSEYAIIVHETPEFHHPYGKYKFLEDPVTAHKAEFYQNFKYELEAIYAMWRTW
jgi:hypothetical protein